MGDFLDIDNCWLNSGYKDIIWAITYRVVNNFASHLKVHPVTFGLVRSKDKETLIERFETIIKQYDIQFTYEFCKDTNPQEYRKKEIEYFNTEPYIPFKEPYIGGEYFTLNLPDNFQTKILSQQKLKDKRIILNTNNVYKKIIELTNNNIKILSYTDKAIDVIHTLKHTKHHFTYCGATAWIAEHMKVPQTIISQDPEYLKDNELKFGNNIHISEENFLYG